MAAELIDGYVSDVLVVRMANDQMERMDGYDPSPTLGVILGYPTAANISYGLQVLNHGEKLVDQSKERTEPPIELYIPTKDGFDIVRTVGDMRAAREQGIYLPTQEEGLEHDARIVGLVQDMNKWSGIFGILPLLQAATGEGDTRIRSTIDPQKDPDGVSPRRTVTPATPESKVALAEDILGHSIEELDPATIGIVGNGPLVGGPLYNEVLPAHGVDTTRLEVVLGTRQQIAEGVPRLHEHGLRLIFTAIPVGALIRREFVNEGTIIIDAGYGINPETGKPSGNVHPNLLALNGQNGNVITSFRRGVGPVTAAVIFDRTIPQWAETTWPSHEFTDEAV